jgi:hypothetical protein
VCYDNYTSLRGLFFCARMDTMTSRHIFYAVRREAQEHKVPAKSKRSLREHLIRRCRYESKGNISLH